MKLKILFSSVAFLIGAGSALGADSKSEARVTQIIREVKILPAKAAAREAVLNDRVAQDTGVRTGGDSRSELTFTDLTITRLGSNTIFSFNNAGRNDQIDSGSILLRVPKDSGGGRIRSSAVTVAVTGTTVILESARGGRNKLYVLEGSARISLVKYPQQFQNVRAAQMVDVPPGATTVPPPTNIDLNDLMAKHPLIKDFPPLPSQNLIMAAANQPPPPTAPSIPSFFPIPVIGFGGGLSGGGTRGTGRNPPNTRPQPPPPRTPGSGQGPSTGPGPSGTGPGRGPVVGPNKSPTKAPPTRPPPPVITRQVPGNTRVPTTSAPKKQPVKKPTPSNNGPR